ncbi:unnamed protein product [Caenorhabditis auriculariae]|uniref:Uncharacterized protein n=1 Tax=Caenorhabditis auriculariae TaxID=2777116 RepID=A0A8S1HB34_9PELO|nr:unnamed protein product [Caenorhabditis auriculariae]
MIGGRVSYPLFAVSIKYMKKYRPRQQRMKIIVALSLFIVLMATTEAAKRCYSGSKDRYESRQCDTGIDGKFVCQKFTCEGGKSPFVLRTCASKSMGWLWLVLPLRQRQLQRLNSFFLDSNFTVRACAPEGSRCEASSTVCADQLGVGVCSICDDDNCNGATVAALFGSLLVVLLVS